MRYLDFLERVHEVLEPPTYLEIGIRHGDSLALARSPSVGIDPAYRACEPSFRTDTALYPRDERRVLRPRRTRSRRSAAGRRLGFIDGMHLVEYALRDFINVERHAAWTERRRLRRHLPARRRRWRHASGRRATGPATSTRSSGSSRGTGPDLICLRVDTRPTGLLLVLGLDPGSPCSTSATTRSCWTRSRPIPSRSRPRCWSARQALDPEAVLSASFWSELRDARDRAVSRAARSARAAQARAPGSRRCRSAAGSCRRPCGARGRLGRFDQAGDTGSRRARRRLRRGRRQSTGHRPSWPPASCVLPAGCPAVAPGAASPTARSR